MEKVTLFSHILPEEQERMWICFQMREIVYENNEIIMEYTNTMKKIGLIAEGQDFFIWQRCGGQSVSDG